MQAPVKANIVDEQIASYAEVCSGLTSELIDEKQKSMNEIESLKKEHQTEYGGIFCSYHEEVQIELV
jgi:hypothetical protein